MGLLFTDEPSEMPALVGSLSTACPSEEHTACEPVHQVRAVLRRRRRRTWHGICQAFLRGMVLHERYVSTPTAAMLRRVRVFFTRIAELLLDKVKVAHADALSQASNRSDVTTRGGRQVRRR